MKIASACLVGGSGFVGRAVAEALCERGLRVRVVSRGATRSRPLWVLPTVEISQADPHDEVQLATCFDGMDAVVNLCGILHETGGQTFEAVHVELPRKIVGACRAAGVGHLVHMSALGASEGGPSDYLRSKARGENAIRESAASLPWTILRPSVIFGEGDKFLNTFAGLVSIFPAVPLAGAGARFQPVWVEDVARAVAAVLGNPQAFGHTLELCGPRAYTLKELVELVGEATGHRRPVIGLPGWAAALQAFTLEHLPGKMMTRDNLKSMSVDNIASGPFPEVLGFRPTPLEAVAPQYLAGSGARARYNLFRYRAGR
jgi:NADH dehydrogenase